MPGFGAVDVHYFDDGRARAAAVRCADARYTTIGETALADLTGVEPYQPGEFWRRELPAIRSVLAAWPPLELLVVDGYVDLDPAGRSGLGAHVHEELRVPVIGGQDRVPGREPRDPGQPRRGDPAPLRHRGRHSSG